MCLVCCGLGIHIDDMMLHALSPTSMGCKTHSNNGPQKRLRHSAVVAE